MCIKLATLSCIKRILYTCWLKYSTPTKMKVIGIPPFLLPAKLESMMSMNTIPDAPSNAEVGNSPHCNYKVIPTAVAKDMTEQPDIE